MARFEQDTENDIYRQYLTEGIKAIAGNTANYAGGNALSKSYSEVLEMAKRPDEKRTADEIIDNILGKLHDMDLDDY